MNFDGYDALTLTDEERKVLQSLHRLSARDGIEYGCAICGGKTSEVFTSHDANAVQIPAHIMEQSGVCLYHSHTNDTLLSSRDYSLLLKSNVEKIAVITPSKFVVIASLNGGLLPDYDEYYSVAGSIRAETNFEMIQNPDFYNFSATQRLEYAINEQSYKIARYFKWKLEGGIFDV